ncbi:MAG: hypothetical protein INR66_27195 [Gordonia polyisoprenivorans]|nr:hypothetical protein [Gordonia polyisoprenivorans]
MAEPRWNADRPTEIAGWVRSQWPSASARSVHRFAQIGTALERARARWRDDPTPASERDFAALRDALAVVATDIGIDPRTDPLPTLDRGFLPGDVARLIGTDEGIDLRDQIWTAVLGRHLSTHPDYRNRSTR